MVRTEIVRALNREKARQAGARPIDAALDRSNRAVADGGGLLVGKARCADEDERLPLIRRQFRQGGAEFVELHPAVLLRVRLQGLGIGAVGVLDLAPPLAVFGAEQVAQDRKQPGGHVRARLERVDVRHGTQQRFLHQIVGAIHVATKRNGECPQTRDRCEHRVTNG